MSHDKEQPFLDRVKQTLDHSVDELDANTRARLKAARLTALESRQQVPLWQNLLVQNRLVLASAMSITLVAGVWLIQKPTTPELPLDDLAILSSTDELELYQDLEFYQWLAYQNEQS